MSDGFEIILTLHENDPESEKLLEVVAALCLETEEATMCGGGGYLLGHPDGSPDKIVTFFIQKNAKPTGDLIDCTEDDRVHALEVLARHVNVSKFLVGPLEADGCVDNEDALVQKFRDT